MKTKGLVKKEKKRVKEKNTLQKQKREVSHNN
jgi:hypothetical protein